MNLHKMLRERAEQENPIRVGLIGAGKFGAMYLAQARLTTGVHIVGIADLNLERARQTLRNVGWGDQQFDAPSFEAALASGRTHLTEDAGDLIDSNGLEVIIEATGDPACGIRHCLGIIESGRHVVMVTVEGDVVAGPLLAQKARQAGVVYSLAWGDQPALMCEHVDWARACGFEVVCAGRGVKYLPEYHESTPETVWDNFFITAEQAARGGMNPKMFNSFIDGSKPAIETSATCNATGLHPQSDGLAFPAGSRFELADICKPRSKGGLLEFPATVEAVSCLRRDGSVVENDILHGTFVVIEADNDYVRHCFEEYHMLPDTNHDYAALYRPTHMIGLELGVSVASAVLRNEPTGTPIWFHADVVATAKRDLRAGEILDGEGGYRVYGKQLPAKRSLQMGGLPLGLASNVKLKRDIVKGASLIWDDVEYRSDDLAVRIRREMEQLFAPEEESLVPA